LDVVATVKKTRLQWLGHIMRMGEDGMPKKILLEEPGGYRKVGRPTLRWLDDVTDDMAKAGVRNWRRRTRTGSYGGRPLRKPRPTSGC
jgi:hypothetical protein